MSKTLWNVGMKCPDLEAELEFNRRMGHEIVIEKEPVTIGGKEQFQALVRIGDKGAWMAVYTPCRPGQPTTLGLSPTSRRLTVEHVRGPGVVGHQPVLKPGDRFQYSSCCPLNTPVGTMHGSYQMALDSGEKFLAAISPFTLAEPYALN